MTSHVRETFRLHLSSGAALWIGGVGALALMASARSEAPTHMVMPVLFVSHAVGSVVGEISRCAFAFVLPGYRQVPRRMLFGVAAALGLFVGAVCHAGGGAPAIGAGVAAMALSLLSSLSAMHSSAWGFGGGVILLALPRSLDPAIAVASAIGVPIAWYLLEPDRCARRAVGRPVTSAGYNWGNRATGYADAMALRRARRREPFASVLVGLAERSNLGAGTRAMLAMMVPTIGRYSGLTIAGSVAIAVALGVWSLGRSGIEDTLFFGFVASLGLLDPPRQKVPLPLDRAMLRRRHAQVVGIAVSCTVLFLLLVDASARLAVSLVPWLLPAPLRIPVLGAALFACGSTTIVPFLHGRLVRGFVGFLVALAAFGVSTLLDGRGVVPVSLTCAAAASGSWLLLAAYYRAIDLA